MRLPIPLRRILPLLLAASMLSSCNVVDTMKEGFAHSNAVSSALEKKLGKKPFVGFNWNNGTLTSVTVSFEGIPANVPLAEIVQQSQAAVAAEFKQVPKQVVVAFAVQP